MALQHRELSVSTHADPQGVMIVARSSKAPPAAEKPVLKPNVSETVTLYCQAREI